MPLNETICALILAAGLSSRMQDFKPLMPLRGKTLIENAVDSVLRGGAEQVVVVTGYRGEELEPLLADRYGSRIILARNEDYRTTDMLCSIQIGCAVMPRCNAFFLLPGDMPVVRQSTFARLLAARENGGRVIFPTLDGYRKHPPLIDASMLPEILAFHEEGGLRRLWSRLEGDIQTVPVDDKGVWVDLDTQEDYRNCKRQYEF